MVLLRLTILAATLLVASAASAFAQVAEAQTRTKVTRLKAFGSCQELVAYGNRHVEQVGATSGGVVPEAPRPAAGVPGKESAPADSVSAGDSATNVQEAGVDEPDIVKADGGYVYAISGDALHAVDIRGPEPRLAGTLSLPAGSGHGLLVRGPRALVVWRRDGGGGPVAETDGTMPSSAGPLTELAEIDLSDPAAMKVARRLEVDGQLVTARMVDGNVRVVITSTPPAMVHTATDGKLGSSRLAGWMPRARFSSNVTGRRHRSPLVGCRAVRRATTFSGLGMVSVLTVDLDQGLLVTDRDAVMTGAETVYAASGALYLATRRWSEALQAPSADAPPPRTTTTIHKFDTSAEGQTTYRGSGAVPGYLLNQFSLSEHDGVLRVASTEEPLWWGGEDETDSQSFVTTLAEQDGRLVERGRVGGLGRGERIFAVRFLGETGYVVTFRQTDPLYTLDLSDPAQPRVLGELKVDGYSAYLHPAGDGLLIGVGQDATKDGRTRGTQVSLFDVSDLRSPRLLHRYGFGADTSSEAEADHHAFLFSPETGLLVIPLAQSSQVEGPPTFLGAVGLRLDPAAGIAEVGRMAQPVVHGEPVPIRRTLIAGGRLYALSDTGLSSTDPATFAAWAWVPFPADGAGP